jgi:hypothetical protein
MSTRAEPLTANGQFCWPPTGNYMAASGQDLMAADTRGMQAGRPWREHLAAGPLSLAAK